MRPHSARASAAFPQLRSSGPFVAPLLALVLACWQFVRVQHDHLTPWKGGGFGMFSTIDSGAGRLLTIEIVLGGKRVAVGVPTSSLTQLTTNLPADSSFEQLGEWLRTAVWTGTESPDNRPSVRAPSWAPWDGRGAFPRSIALPSSFCVTVFAPAMSLPGTIFTLNPIASRSIPGMSLNDFSRLHDVDPSYLRVTQ